MQQQSCKFHRCADLKHFGSLYFQSVHESCLSRWVEKRQWKRIQLHVRNSFHQKVSIKHSDFARFSSVTPFLLQYWTILLRNISFNVVIRDSMVYRGKAQWESSALKGSLHHCRFLLLSRKILLWILRSQDPLIGKPLAPLPTDPQLWMGQLLHNHSCFLLTNPLF